MRVQLRPPPTPEELDRLYPAPHEHTRWDDHKVRVAVTAGIGTLAMLDRPMGTVVDLSCGDAAIPRMLARLGNAPLVLGDYAPGYPITGPIEETVQHVPDGAAHLWVCSETTEHLTDPDAVLKAIRPKTDWLLLSTPEGEEDPELNPEHIWGWDTDGVGEMLAAAGFAVRTYNLLDLRHSDFVYAFQIWLCR